MRARIVGLCLVAAIATVVLIVRGGDDHTLRAAFTQSNNVVRGLEVRMAGSQVGHVSKVTTADGHARVDLSLDDDVWPLRAGTHARIRFGPTAGYTTRYVELLPGPRTAPALQSGALLALDVTEAPIEFDDVVRTFDATGRRNLAAALRTADRTLTGTGAATGRGIDAAGDALPTLAGVLQQLVDRPAALPRAVRGAARTSVTLAEHDRALRDAVAGIAATLDELADHRPELREALPRLPGALADVTSTLHRTDRSVDALNELTTALAPGARELRATAGPLRDLEGRLHTAAPLLESTLLTLRSQARPIARLLAEGVPVLRQTTAVTRTATPMLACLRPYGPELAGVLSTWSGFGMHYDALGHYARAELQVSPFTSNSTGLRPDQVAGVLPGTEYAMPRAPGFNAGTPWYQPDCGITADGLNPSLDPEGGK